MAQKHDIGVRKRRKNAEALERQELRRQAALELERQPMHSKDEA